MSILQIQNLIYLRLFGDCFHHDSSYTTSSIAIKYNLVTFHPPYRVYSNINAISGLFSCVKMGKAVEFEAGQTVMAGTSEHQSQKLKMVHITCCCSIFQKRRTDGQTANRDPAL